MTIRNSIRAATVIFATVFSLSASAANETTTLGVSATNVAVVTVSTTAIAFGDVATSTTNPTATGTITVNATSLLAYKIAIDSGLNGWNSGGCRSMVGTGSGAASRKYDTYTDSGYTTQWGDSDFGNTCAGATNDGGASKSVIGTGNDQVHTVYARAYSGTVLGAMSDTLTVTVHY